MSVHTSYDAIFIGTGHNALVTAAYLARAGWRVLLLEQQAHFGGWVCTEEATLPGFRHDLYASIIPLWLTSPVHAELGSELESFGLRFLKYPRPTGVAMADGKSAVLSMAMDENVKEFETLARGDGEAWTRILETFGKVAPAIGELFSSDMSTSRASELMREIFVSSTGAGPSPFASEFLMSSRELLERRFRSPVTRALLGSWPMHAGRGPDAAQSALWVPLICGTLQAVGAPIVAGGVAGLTDALVRMIEHHGGTLLAGRSVSRILVEGGQAVGVRTETDETFRAERAVVASTNPDQLYLKLLADTPAVPPDLRQQAENHRYGFGFVQLHLALSEPPRWNDQRLAEAGIVHLTPGIDAISRGVNEATRGLLPAEPTIGLDVPSLPDPSRAPEGCAVMRVQAAESPIVIRGDAAGEIDVGEGEWTTEVKRRFADRMLRIVARHVPNLLSSIKAMAIVSPAELAVSNPNAGPGAISSAPRSIAEYHLFRSNHHTAFEKLFQVGAATWPGPAVSGASGYILAQTLLSDRIE